MTFKNGIVVEGTPEELERVARWGLTGQEVQPEQPKKERPKVGQYVRILTDERDLPKGSIAKITKDDEDHLPFLCVSLDDSDFDYYREDEIEVIPADEAKWAAIGRKVDEFKVGDIVRLKNDEFAVKAGTLSEVMEVHDGGIRIAQDNGNGVGLWSFFESFELVCPVEQRFDKTE